MFWKLFLILSLYILEKKFLVNKYKKQMCYEENKSLFLRLWKMAKFFIQKFVIFNMTTAFFLVEKWGTCKEIHMQKLLNLNFQDRVCFGIYEVA